MELQKIKIKEFKVLKDIEFTANGANIILLGDNGVGKSSVIQFIEICLGKKTNIPPNARGSGEIVTTINGQEYTYSVVFKGGKPLITVTAPNGIQDDRRSVIAALVGAMDFDIDAFVEMSRSSAGRNKQVKIFKTFLPIEIQEELNKLENKVRLNYDDRTQINRDIKSLTAEIKAHPLLDRIPFDTFEQVDVAKVYEKLKDARDHNQKVEEINTRVLERLDRVLELEHEVKALKTKNKDAKVWLKENIEVDLLVLEKTLESATKTNTEFDSSEALRVKIKTLAEYEEESGEATALIDSSKQLIVDAIKDMDLPVDGLAYEFIEDPKKGIMESLTYKGIAVHPDSLSTAEIGHLGVKMKMAENPDLNILFLQNGQNYGSKKLEEIKSYGWQIIMEQVERNTEELKIEIMGN